MSRITRTTCLIAVFALALGLPLAGCGDDGGGGSKPAASEPPTKAEALATLRALFAAMEGKSWDEAAKHVDFGPKPPSDVGAAFERLLKLEEISKSGIDVLEARGTFETGADALGGRVGSQAERGGIDAASCFGFALENAEVIGYRGADGIKIMRLNNVGKLK